MNVSLNICSIFEDKTCWDDSIQEMNKANAKMMIPVAIMMYTFMVVGVIGNALVIVVYVFKQNKTSAHILIMCLAIIDLIACSVIHPYVIYKIYHYYDQTWVVACKIFEFLVHLNLAASGISLLVVAIDRYLAICKPVKYLKFDVHVVKAISITITIAIIISLPLLEFYGMYCLDYNYNGKTIVGCRCEFTEIYQGSTSQMSFSAFIMLLFLVEVIIMSVLYKNVAMTAYRSRKTVVPMSNAQFQPPSTELDDPTSGRVATHTNDTESSVLSARPLKSSDLFPLQNVKESPAQTDKSHNVSTELKSRSALFSVEYNRSGLNREISLNRYKANVDKSKDKKLFNSKLKAAKILFLVTAVFFLSWIPFFIMRICSTLNQYYWVRETEAEIVVETLLNHFFYINNAVNPIIYTIINKNFRRECVYVISKQLRCR